MEYQYTILSYNLAAQHIDELVDIEQKTIEVYGDSFDTSIWKKEQFLKPIPKKDMLSCCVICDGRVIAYSIGYEFSEAYAHISRLVVHPDNSGKGIGSKLLAFQLAVMERQGITKCSIDLVKKNAAARELYSRNGFRQLDGIRLNDYVQIKNRDNKEYLGTDATHIALIKDYEKI